MKITVSIVLLIVLPLFMLFVRPIIIHKTGIRYLIYNDSGELKTAYPTTVSNTMLVWAWLGLMFGLLSAALLWFGVMPESWETAIGYAAVGVAVMVCFYLLCDVLLYLADTFFFGLSEEDEPSESRL